MFAKDCKTRLGSSCEPLQHIASSSQNDPGIGRILFDHAGDFSDIEAQVGQRASGVVGRVTGVDERMIAFDHVVDIAVGGVIEVQDRDAHRTRAVAEFRVDQPLATCSLGEDHAALFEGLHRRFDGFGIDAKFFC